MSVTDTTSSLSMNDILANSSKKASSTTSGGIASATNSATGGRRWARMLSCNCWSPS